MFSAGVLLSFGGFLSFMLTGSVSAIRFGVVLGGTLLALSVSSLRSWKRGESSSLALKGQAGSCLRGLFIYGLFYFIDELINPVWVRI